MPLTKRKRTWHLVYIHKTKSIEFLTECQCREVAKLPRDRQDPDFLVGPQVPAMNATPLEMYLYIIIMCVKKYKMVGCAQDSYLKIIIIINCSCYSDSAY